MWYFVFEVTKMGDEKSEDKKVKAVIHAVNVGPAEQAKFNRTLTVDQIIDLLRTGTSGRKLLLKKRANPDDNVVIEYKGVGE